MERLIKEFDELIEQLVNLKEARRSVLSKESMHKNGLEKTMIEFEKIMRKTCLLNTRHNRLVEVEVESILDEYRDYPAMLYAIEIMVIDKEKRILTIMAGIKDEAEDNMVDILSTVSEIMAEENLK